MLEPEMAYYYSDQNMKLQEELVSYIANTFAKKDGDIIDELKLDKGSLLKVKPPFKRISYEKALEKLNENGAKVKWGDDFGVAEEKLLTENEEKPIFIYNWAKEIKAFSAAVNPDDPRTVLSDDMQAPHGHGEMVGGTEREWRLENLLARMREVEKQKGIKFNMKNYE
jgi:asparaginyl-tRNA synthetase